jgi:hypothetical protein
MLPPLATHFLKNSVWSRHEPLALPAAGLPITRGGNCFSRRIWHFFATSAVMALARVTMLTRTVAQMMLTRRLDLKGTARTSCSMF